MFIATIITHGPGRATETHGIAALVAHLDAWRAAFPDLVITVDDVIAEGRVVAMRWTWSGTHHGTFLGVPPTGKAVTVPTLSMHRFEGRLCAEQWVQTDRLGLLRQLGTRSLPADGT